MARTALKEFDANADGKISGQEFQKVFAVMQREAELSGKHGAGESSSFRAAGVRPTIFECTLYPSFSKNYGLSLYQSTEMLGAFDKDADNLVTLDELKEVGATPIAPVLMTPTSITNQLNPTIAGTAEAGGAITIYDGDASLGTTVASSTGAWTFTPDAELTEAAHTITATVRNAAGAISPASSPITLTIDRTAPASPKLTSSSGFTNNTTPMIKGLAEAGSTVTVYDGDASLGTTVASSTGEWTLTPSKALTQADHKITANATDAAGNLSDISSSITLTVDTTAPDHPVLTTVSGSSKNATPTIEGATDPGGVVIVYDGDASLGTTVASPDGTWKFTPTKPLEPGDHSITARSRDSAGNVSTASAAITLTVIPLTPEERADALLADYGGTEKGYVEIADILNAWINDPSRGDVRELANTMQAWDTNGDGQITRKEMVTNFRAMDVADGLLLEFAPAPTTADDPVAVRLRDVTDADLQPFGLTHDLLASWDLDGTGAVTRAELLMGLRPLIDRPPTPAELAQAMLNQFDADKSNGLSLDEFQNALGGAANASQGDFESWDANKDQSISLDEITTGVDAIQKATAFVAQYARNNNDYFDITDIQAAIDASPDKDKMAPAEEILAAWDMDGDGKVTIQEVMTIQQLNKSTPTTT